jgi:predicted nucleotidyltransferase component of viral defense system
MDHDHTFRLSKAESLHLEVMRTVAKQVQDTPYVLKGGAALILTRQLDRYSSDLDFDAALKLNLTGRIERALKSIDRIALRSIKLVKDTDTVQRYKIHYADRNTDQDTLLKVETSLRESPPSEAVEIVSGIRTYRVEYLFDQKLSAAQNRTEARDLYDLAFLVEQFGSQLQDHQIEAMKHFVADPDQLFDQYKLVFKTDEALSNTVKIEDAILSLHFGVEKLHSERNLRVSVGEGSQESKNCLNERPQIPSTQVISTSTSLSPEIRTQAIKVAHAANNFLECEGLQEFDGKHWNLKRGDDASITITNKKDGRIILRMSGEDIRYAPQPEDRERLEILVKNCRKRPRSIRIISGGGA